MSSGSIRREPTRSLLGIGLTLIGMLGASAANVFQAREEVRRFPLFALLAWAMAIGAVIDSGHRACGRRPAGVRQRGPAIGSALLYLALFASVLAFSLYFPVVRKIGPGKAAYSSVIVPIIAMGFRPRSKAIAGRRWRLPARCWRSAG